MVDSFDCTAGGGALAQEPAPVLIQVNGVTHYQTFEGFGGSQTAFEKDGIFKAHDPSQPERVTVSPEDRAAIAQLVYGELGINRTRVVLAGFEPANDNGDPFTLNPAGFDWSLVDAEIGGLAVGQEYGLLTGWASFSLDGGDKDAWRRLPGNACALDPAQIDEEVEWLLAAALHFRDQGMELTFMAINNEPDLCPPGYKIEIADFVTIVKRLGARLRENGLSTLIVVSDGWIPQNAVLYMQATLSDPDARQYVGALAYHSYDAYGDPNAILSSAASGSAPHNAVEARQQIRDLAAEYSLPVWMTEVCYCVPQAHDVSDYTLVWARLNHVYDELTITNVAAFDVMNVAFIYRPGVDDEPVTYSFRPDGTLDKYEISLYGYLLGHYSRFITHGSVRVDVTSSDPLVRVVAFRRPDSSVVVVALNNNSAAVNVTLSLAGFDPMPAALSTLTSTEAATWQARPDLPLTNGEAEVSLPPMSVTTFIAFRVGN